jgi:peptidyl-prolyl isomerase D
LPLLNNAALCALKCSPPSGTLAITHATKALALPNIEPVDKAKALYRRAQGRVLQKDEDGAESDLKAALVLQPGAPDIMRTLRDVEKKRKDRKDKERAAYSKMFG